MVEQLMVWFEFLSVNNCKMTGKSTQSRITYLNLQRMTMAVVRDTSEVL